MQKHVDLPLARVHDSLLRLKAEALFAHQLPEQGLPPSSRVGDQDLAVGGEQGRHEDGQGLGVAPLVEHVGGEYEVEGAPETLRYGGAPVEEPGVGLAVVGEVEAGVVAGEVE